MDDMCMEKLTQPNTKPSLKLQLREMYTPTYSMYIIQKSQLPNLPLQTLQCFSSVQEKEGLGHKIMWLQHWKVIEQVSY